MLFRSLESFLVHLRAVRLSGYAKNGHGIARCGIQTGQHVGAGGPRSAQANTDIAGMGAREAFGHVRGAFHVPGQNMQETAVLTRKSVEEGKGRLVREKPGGRRYRKKKK